jgi:GH25 family lysozyme M1 (1,4-beta-N-acetylmuramidase)
MTHAEGKVHQGHENVHLHHDQHHPSHRRRKPEVKPGDGIDVSEANGSVDWKRADKGLGVAIAKATEGATYRDKLWAKERVKEMEATHARVALYHFCRPENNKPEAEVANLLRAVEAVGIDLVGAHWYDGKAKVDGWRVFADFETAPFSASWLDAWGKEFERQTHHKADLYGYGASLNPVAGAVLSFHRIDFAAYVSDWKPYLTPSLHPKVAFWQHSSTGSWPGVSGHVDLDRYLL